MKIRKSLPAQLLIGVAGGVVLGLYAGKAVMNVVVVLQYLLGQMIMFCVPLIIIGFIAPSITKLGKNASRILRTALLLAYGSSVGAALFSMGSGYLIIPYLNVTAQTGEMRSLPELAFSLDIPPLMSVMSALILSVLFGLAATWSKASVTVRLLDEFQKIVLMIVTKVVIPLLPLFIAVTFCTLSYEGTIAAQLPVFFKAILLIVLGQYLWLLLLYTLAGLYAKKSPLAVLRHYGSAYLTAVGTMSSAATLAVALKCAGKSKVLRSDMIDFGIPLFANIHLCGGVLTEVFFAMVASKLFYGHIPPVATMFLFCILLAIFAIGAPGVPGGTLMASLGLLTGILGFGETATALMITVFALQDSFGTACNITGDGALTLMLTGYVERHHIAAAGAEI